MHVMAANGILHTSCTGYISMPSYLAFSIGIDHTPDATVRAAGAGSER
jgi:hypothetical protein